MPPHLHHMFLAPITIPLGVAGIVGGAYLAHRLGLPRADNPLMDLRQLVTLALMLGVGAVLVLPVTFAFDRLVPARCPSCGRNAAYRVRFLASRFHCRACRAEAKA